MYMSIMSTMQAISQSTMHIVTITINYEPA